eukprot:TRINITY_DN27699_c0_g1_i1.p1 TRINITY_DN27699_c0_g1~~TRINITY_DN27699_c0_g1_i1.p1  ORF type:complete len:574 (+),score=135.86 TRINITY_DN27699_c0_g1_i1:629-2350(+)
MRRGTEFGVAPLQQHVLFRPASGELLARRRGAAGMALRLVAPTSYPAGQPVPVVAVLVSRRAAPGAAAGASGEWLRLTALLRAQADGAPVRMWRGVTAVQYLREAGDRPVPARPEPGGMDTARPAVRGTQPGTLAVDLPCGSEVCATGRAEVATPGEAEEWEGTVDSPEVAAGGVVRVRGPVSLRGSAVVQHGAVLLFEHGASLTLDPGARLALAGAEGSPVSLVAADASRGWGGIVVGAGATVSGAWALCSGAGAAPRSHPATGTHRKEEALFSVLPEGSLTLTHGYITMLRGPAFGLAKGSRCTLREVYAVGVQQGGECVMCTLSLHSAFVGSVPDDSPAFVDGDNDGWYFRGGSVVADGLVVVNAKDDCVDSASSKGHSGGNLTISNSVLENCMHEGIALSASHGTERTVLVRDSAIVHAQQGVEVGYTPPTHSAEVSRVLFAGCVHAVRYGDNYNLAVQGRLSVRGSVFWRNAADAVSYVKRSSGAPKGAPPLRLSGNLLGSNASALYCAQLQWAPGEGEGELSNAVFAAAAPADAVDLAALELAPGVSRGARAVLGAEAALWGGRPWS